MPVAEFSDLIGWQGLAILASTVALLIYALVLGIAKGLMLDDLERTAKSELLQIAANVLMIVVFLTFLTGIEEFAYTSFFQGVNSVSCGDVDIGDSGTISSGLDLLRCRIAEKAESFTELHGQVRSSADSTFTKLSIYFGIAGLPVVQGNYFGDLYREAESYRLMNNLLTNLTITSNAILVLIDYLKANLLATFLPLGLFLRSFSPTRGVGALFMSLAIGFYFIFPVLYVVSDPEYHKPDVQALAAPDDAPFCYPTFSNVIRIINFSGPAAAKELSMRQLSEDISGIYLTLLLQPFVIVAITLVFVRYLMYLLGGDGQTIMRFVSKVV